METLLNVVWVLVSACGIGAGIVHLYARRDRPAIIHSAVALVLIAVLLFPVISLTDDLRPITFASEDISRRGALSTLAHSPALHDVAFFAIGFAFPFASLVAVGFFVPGAYTAQQRMGLTQIWSPRAPPLSN